jgi:hypothetical protein
MADAQAPLASHAERVGSLLRSPWAAITVGGGSVLALLLTIRAIRHLTRPIARIAAVAATLAWIGASPPIGGLILLGALMLEGASPKDLLGRLRGLAVAGVVATLGWLAAAFAVVQSSHSGLESAARILLGFPAPNWFEFALAAPGIFGLACIGAIVATDRASRVHDPAPAPWLMLVAAAFAPLLIGGLVMRSEGLRYMVHALAPMLLLALVAAEWLASRLLRQRMAFFAALLITGVAVRPDQTLAAILREHGPIEQPFAVLNVAPDHRGAAAYVRQHARDEDWVAAEDSLQQRLYLGRADLWLRRYEDAAMYLVRGPGDEVLRDVYVGARHVNNLDDLRSAASETGHRVVWLITSGEVEGAPDWYRTPETNQILHSWQDRAWFVGRDGLTRVYRLVDGQPAPRPDAAPEVR